MRALLKNDIEMEYRVFGKEDAPAMLLVMGLGGQLTCWPQEFVSALVKSGYRVVVYDNRDAGLSTFIEKPSDTPLQVVVKKRLFMSPITAYGMEDMMRDGVYLMDHLGIERFHVCGVSMGASIGQMMAFYYPQRVITLTSLMGTDGHPSIPRTSLRVSMALLAAQTKDHHKRVERKLDLYKIIGSKNALQRSDQWVRDHQYQTFTRQPRSDGSVRQLAAILAEPHRRHLLPQIKCPALFIHGNEDKLISPKASIDMAAVMPNSRLSLIDDMGHDIPIPLASAFAQQIAELR